MSSHATEQMTEHVSPHRVEIAITPICACCGKPLKSHGAASTRTGSGFNPFEYGGKFTAQSVYVEACGTCFVLKADVLLMKPETTDV